MATNSASSNPIGFRTGPVTATVPPVPAATVEDIKRAAAAEVLQPHLRRLQEEERGRERGREKEMHPVESATGTGDEFTERTK